LSHPVAILQLFAGDFRAAFASAQAQLRGAAPPDARMVLVLAAIAVEHGNTGKALELLDLARSLGGAEGWRLVLEGRVALALRDTATARRAARSALEAGVEHPEIAGQLGVLLSRTGLHTQALPLFEQASKARPDDPQIAYNRAIALQFAGDLVAAREAFAALVGAHPDHAQGWLALVQLDRQHGPALLAQLEARYRAATEAEARLALGHAIAKTLEDLGRWDESLDWLDRAKAGRRADVKHSRAEADALFAAAAQTASVPLPPADAAGDVSPVFITGLPRSGTTLVERILSAHPAVRSAGELSDFSVLLKQRTGTPGPLVLDPATLLAGISADLSGLEEEYAARARSIVGACDRFIDKMPFNFFFVPSILKALPGAKVICLRRSPFDALLSNYRQLFATAFTYYSYAYDFDDTAHFVARYEKLADLYSDVLPPERFRTQRYEGVVADLEGEARALVDFLGLTWNDACLRFHENSAPVATASSVQVRQPIYSSSLERWRRYSRGAQRALAAFKPYGIVPGDQIRP
jgi:tetratricopeptide (TPR) repeat protein